MLEAQGKFFKVSWIYFLTGKILAVILTRNFVGILPIDPFWSPYRGFFIVKSMLLLPTEEKQELKRLVDDIKQFLYDR